MKVLVSAYACEPGRGSEPGAGWAFALAAAQEREVWLLTRRNNSPAIDAALADDRDLPIHPVYMDLPAPLRALKRGAFGTIWYYPAWQVRAALVARKLHRRVHFDVAHHVTFATDWMPAGVAYVPGLPFVWGPVGGSTGTAWRLWRWLGLRGLLTDALRGAVPGVLRRVITERTARRAGLVVAQNDDVARRFAGAARKIVVRPNVVLARSATPTSTRVRDASSHHRAVFVGRLVAWKGVRLAVAVMAEPQVRDWRLDFYGDGPERRALQRLARRFGVSDRVRILGQRPRQEVIDQVASATAFLFPSTHDSAPWAVGEALMLGCPVVCLDRGGPPNIIGAHGGIAVPVGTHTASRLADALVEVACREWSPIRWDESGLTDELRGWYDAALQRQPLPDGT
jgi:glycosyltransferase involved in cell wall biosynthesis